MQKEYERFIKKVAIPENKDDCWIWLAGTRRRYGQFHRIEYGKRISEKAHRYSYEYHNGINKKVMKGYFVCHTCDNPLCVNPKHLFLGTAQDNHKDMLLKGRNSFGRNKAHKWLSKEIALQIRNFKLKNPNVLNKQIAKIYDISTAQVSRILNNKIWKE